MSTRPAPRPRPRPRPRAATNEPASSSPSAPTAPLPTPLEPVSINVATEDEDALFFKNRNRNPQSWMRMRKLAEESEVKKPKPASDGESESEKVNATPKRKQRKGGHAEPDSLPAWTKSEAAIVVSSSDEEDEILRRIDKASPKSKRVAREDGSKRVAKRARSRSRSITPPPALAYSAVQQARERVMRLLGEAPRAPSPTGFGVGDDSVDGIELDPELAIIARTAKIEVQRQASSTPAVGAASSRSPSPVHGGGPEEVLIRVRWLSHPLNPEPKRVTYEYKMRRHDSFRELFDETADSAGVLADHLIITYDGKRIFPSASPHGVGVWNEASFEGCDKATYDYIRTHRHTTPALGEDDTHEPARALSEAPSDAASGDDEGDKMKLTFRSAVTKPIVLTVRPTTTCSTILQAFLKRAGLSDKYPAAPVKKGRKGKNAASAGPALMVDGKKLSPDAEIGSADLDDGDLVEVVGL